MKMKTSTTLSPMVTTSITAWKNKLKAKSAIPNGKTDFAL
jgi:hypothetical protein